MIADPMEDCERLACHIMKELMSRGLIAVDCAPTGEGMCERQLRFVSGAMEQLSAVIAEWLDFNDDGIHTEWELQ